MPNKSPSNAVKWFLNRQLASFEIYKKFPAEELDRRIVLLDPQPDFNKLYPLRTHQKAMFLIGLAEPRFLIFSGIGSGKTLVSLTLFNYRRKLGLARKMLAVALDEQNVDNWLDEAAKHVPHLKALGIIGSKSERRELVTREADIYIINYGGLKAVLDSPADDPNAAEIRKLGKNRRAIYPNVVAEFAKRFQFLALDEGYELSNQESVNFQICNILTNHIPDAYELTGRPFGRDLLKLWSQFYVIDKGETLGKNIYIFMNSYFNSVKLPWGRKWSLDNSLKPHLYQTLKNRSIVFSRSDYQKVIEPDRQRFEVGLSTEALSYYQKIAGDLVDQFHDVDRWRKHIKNQWMKLRQVCSGFLKYKLEDEEDSGRFTDDMVTFDCLKDKTIENIVLSTPDDCKHIIYHEFVYTGIKLAKILDKMGVGYVTLSGLTKDKIGAKRAFQYDKDINWLVANSRSGSTGLNLQMANYETFYESNASPIVREQAEGRILRDGQLHDQTNIFDVIVKDSIEGKILDFHKHGDNLYEAVLLGRINLKNVVGKIAGLK